MQFYFMLVHSHLLLGYQVAQLCLLFQLEVDQKHPLSNRPLAYVHLFMLTSMACPNSHLYKVSKEECSRGRNWQPLGVVVELTSIAWAIHLIPHYGPAIHECLNSKNSLNLCHTFWVNSFLDKETYQAVYWYWVLLLHTVCLEMKWGLLTFPSHLHSAT